jgi:hypothetical protein
MHPSPSCQCLACTRDLETAWRLHDRNPQTDLNDICKHLHPFLHHVRRESHRTWQERREPNRGPRMIEAKT